MVHRKEWYNKYLGNWAYTKFFYSYFLDEHIKGHHKTVATPDDPCSARLNEPAFMFLPRTIIG
jgi:alkane 1-monooxygenase